MEDRGINHGSCDAKLLRHILNSELGAGELMKFIGRMGRLKASHGDIPFSDH